MFNKLLKNILFSIVLIFSFTGNVYCHKDQNIGRIDEYIVCEYEKNTQDRSVKNKDGSRNSSDPKLVLAKQKKITAALLCFFLGNFGAHRFYVGKIGTGVLQLLTIGGLRIWSTVDLILILCDEFTNAEGQKLS